jgi:hypothetical protein
VSGWRGRGAVGLLVDEVPAAYLAMLDAETAFLWGLSSIRRPLPDRPEGRRVRLALAAAGSLVSARIHRDWECGC